ncbi:HEPN domain-containing protein [Leptolyngbya sp. AN02str]|uniref:ApeA N-terminal domain 1-containing protein n=1 Tax=Leptolyngbya sp. AN02str TaxID=3423363 RepID=UPI003D31C912
MQELEEVGIWWIPSDPDFQVSGLLKFSSSTGIRLELIGSFQEYRKVDCPIILGVTQGKLVTLCGNKPIHSRSSSPGFESEKYSVKTAFIGAHFSNLDEMKFHRIAVEYSYLADWANLPLIRRQEELEEDNYNIRGFDFSYTRPEPIRGNTSQGVLSLVYTWHNSGLPFQINFSQSATFEIKSQEHLSFEEWMSKLIFTLQNFITLATDRPNSVTRVLGFSPYGDRAIEETPHFTKQDVSIEIIYRSVYTETRQKDRLLRDDLLFELKDIQETFGDTMAQWLTIAAELDSVCNLFFSTRYSQRMYQENHFLNIVQAVESYHRRRRSNRILPKQEHEKRINRIVNNASEGDKEWLKQKLAFSNEPSLKERLVYLVKETREIIAPLVNDEEPFIKQVRDTRNYLTHYDKSLQKKAVKGGALYWLTYTLEILLQTCFLKELGFSSEQCVALFDKNERYQFAIRETKGTNN